MEVQVSLTDFNEEGKKPSKTIPITGREGL
jgi:hypothetical protein